MDFKSILANLELNRVIAKNLPYLPNIEGFQAKLAATYKFFDIPISHLRSPTPILVEDNVH